MLRMYAGLRVPVDENGYLTNDRDWSLSIGESIAEEFNVEMTADHWFIINIVREAYADKRKVPDWDCLLRRSSWDVEEIKGLFPNNPKELIARIAGMPKELA